MPEGLIKLKKKEFLSLEQGSMSVCEYRDKFIQLSCYAPNVVKDDEKKQGLFLDGLNDGIQMLLLANTYDNFQ